MALVFRLSALPGSDVPGRFGPLGHFALYAVLGGLYFAALDPTTRSTRAATVAVALASAYGITDEYHQYFVPGRTNDPVDWLVDTAGAAAAVALIAWVARRRESSAQ
jgi:VanZ family protein